MSQRVGIGKVASGGTELGRVRGLGSAREGTGHFIQQRLTALANVALVVWLIVSLVRLDLTSHQAVAGWLASPFAAVPMVLLIGNVFWHIRLGLQTLIEDYAHGAMRLPLLIALNFYALAGAAFGIFSVVRIALAAGYVATGVPA